MNKQLIKSLPLAVFIIAMNTAYAADEELERSDIEQPIIDMVYKEKWNKLDELFAQYINGFPATSNGTQKIIVAYGAITGTYANGKDGGEEVADSWLKANPDSTVAQMLKALSYGNKAFFLRGEGDINSVDNDVWPRFNKLIQQQKEYLLEHKNIADKDPMWYQTMITVGRNQNDHALIMQMLDEGSRKYPTYQNLYLTAMEGSLPKWGGDPESVEKIARLAASKTTAQSGNSYYTYIWYNALSFQPEMMQLLANKKVVSWDTMKAGWHDRYKQYPTARIATEYMSTACVAGDASAFAEGYSWINNQYGDLVQQVWLPGTGYNECEQYFKSQQ